MVTIGKIIHLGHHIRIKYKKKKTKNEKIFKKNPEKKKRNEEKDEIKKQLLIEIGKNKAELEEINQKVYNDLMYGINILYQLALKNNELNKIALQTDDERLGKYGYARRLLLENTDIKKDSKVYSFFEDSLNDIEDICSNDDSKERKVSDFQKKLLEEDVE